jgi:hypothetical protein
MFPELVQENFGASSAGFDRLIQLMGFLTKNFGLVRYQTLKANAAIAEGAKPRAKTVFLLMKRRP